MSLSQEFSSSHLIDSTVICAVALTSFYFKVVSFNFRAVTCCRRNL